MNQAKTNAFFLHEADYHLHRIELSGNRLTKRSCVEEEVKRYKYWFSGHFCEETAPFNRIRCPFRDSEEQRRQRGPPLQSIKEDWVVDGVIGRNQQDKCRDLSFLHRTKDVALNFQKKRFG